MIFTNDRDFHERMRPDDLLCSVLRRITAGGVSLPSTYQTVVLRIGEFTIDLRPDEARRMAELLVQHAAPQ
jgi:hypothetical protein